MRILCFPHAGAGASHFRSWRIPEIETIAVNFPGRESRFSEAPCRRIETLLNDVVARVEPLCDEPFALLGHSMGALVTFELAHELRRRKLPSPAHIFVSAFRAPHLPDKARAMHALSEAALKAELLRLEGTPSNVLNDPELLTTLLPTLRADLELVEKYRYKQEPPLSCGLTCLGGLADRRIAHSELTEWRRHTSGEFRLRLFPGGHFYLFQTPHLVQRAICADLGAAQAIMTEAS